MEAFTIEASFERFASRVDGSYTLTFCTSKETAPETVAVLSIALRTEGYVAYKPGQWAENDLKAIPERKIERSDKTPSQRLRAVMHVIASQNGLVADEYYGTEMEKLISHYKAKIAD